MPLNVVKYLDTQKKTIKQNRQTNKFLKKIFFLILYLILFLVLGIFALAVGNWYTINIKYAIALPTINAYFQQDEESIRIGGLCYIVGDTTATLSIEDLICYKKNGICESNNVIILPAIDNSRPSVYAIHNKYIIKSWDDNKILFFLKEIKGTTGTIDLKLKTLTYTIPYLNNENQRKYRKVKVETDYNKVQELEEKIIKKNKFKTRIF